MRLLEFQRTGWMTRDEAATLRSEGDLIHARLRFFGEVV